MLGYDIDPQGYRLILNEDEAARVRVIVALYLEYEALLPVVQELERRGWVNKRWTTRAGQQCGGQPFTKTSLRRLLTNVLYIGKVRYNCRFVERLYRFPAIDVSARKEISYGLDISEECRLGGIRFLMDEPCI